MIRRRNRATLDAYICALLGGRSPAQAGSRCKKEQGTT